ncbi:MAG TPA: hypothetical protein ENH99_01565 [Candidatus Pacearchaeota archaeon]|nr:hypothetical protein [Candidatus Pacearchaeota archaeon]
MFCRVCELTIGEMGWANHVKAHKTEYCRRFGLDRSKWYDIDWENVVKAFNPRLAKNEVKPIKTEQKTLEAF